MSDNVENLNEICTEWQRRRGEKKWKGERDMSE